MVELKDCQQQETGQAIFPPRSALSIIFTCFQCYHLATLSRASYITAAFIFASGHPGLEIKILYYCTLQNMI